MGLETLVKSTQASSLEWDQGERHIDRIVALAMATAKNDIGSSWPHASDDACVLLTSISSGIQLSPYIAEK